MKRILYTLAIAAAAVSSAMAQTMSVNCGNVSYHFKAETAAEIPYADGKLTFPTRQFETAGITNITMVAEPVADNNVAVTYSEGKAHVAVAGNIAQYIEASINGAHVTLTQSDLVGDDTCGEITYILEGQTADGSFTLKGDYKASIELHGLTLTNPSGAAIDIQNGKRTALRVQEGTVNTLADGASGSQKAALYCKGHLEFKQKGTLNVAGYKAHAIAAKEYIEIKNTTINITASAKDGINCNQYMLVESGTINISGVADDGIQVSFKDDTDREAEDTGTFTAKGGTFNITTTGDATKCIKADGDVVIKGGTFDLTASGPGIWDSAALKTKAASCIGADGDGTISGGTLTLTATNGGGKGINVDGNLTIDGGTFDINTTGGMLAYVNGQVNQNYTGNSDNLKSDYKSSPKGIKVDGDIVVNDGNIFIYTKGNGGEGMESKKTITINGGDIEIRAYEDGTNSTSTTTINGGSLTVTTATGDAIDSNSDIRIYGGLIRVIGAGGAECGLDAGDGAQVWINGGTILAGGGRCSAPTNSTNSHQAYVILTMSLTAGKEVSISNGTTTLCTFTVPDAYGPATTNAPSVAGPGGGNWGWGGTTGSGNTLLLSCPEMVSGTTYTITHNGTTTTSAARTTGGGNGM